MSFNISIMSYNIEGLTLEHNYRTNHSLKSYIAEKSIYLNAYLSNSGIDIIAIQEYTPILNISLSEYYHVAQSGNAIFYSKSKFAYVSHSSDANGLSVIMSVLAASDLPITVHCHRLPPYTCNDKIRATYMATIDNLAKDKLFIFASDTNMRKCEETILDNLIDCWHYTSSKSNQMYTIDKKSNPYFSGDSSLTITSRYDKIFCTDLFSCKNLTVVHPLSDSKLCHPIYPYGNISDHYPIIAILSL